ncbi:MAG: hypothetical protein DWQ02_03100 [Bacteroidetes bacterium]|nr:MAG: hypothetical protein DWQ02_03100 [Bacteroidota bacterium]
MAMKKKMEQNREYILDFFFNISGKEKTRRQLSAYIIDPVLINTLCTIEGYMPQFQLLPDEIMVENNRIIVQARAIGFLAETGKPIAIPFVLGCRIEGSKIINHWFLADELSLMQQITQLTGQNHQKTK